MSALAEFTTAEWAARPPRLRRRRVRHEPSCKGNCGHVFRCRGHGKPRACGKYVGACLGGDGNLCNDCWFKREARKRNA